MAANGVGLAMSYEMGQFIGGSHFDLQPTMLLLGVTAAPCCSNAQVLIIGPQVDTVWACC